MNSKENLDNKVSEFWKFLEDDKLKEAEEIVESLLKEYDEEPVTHYVNGHLYFARNEFEKAVNSFKVSLSKSDKEKFLSFVNYWIGEVYNHKTGNFFSDNENELHGTSIAEEYFLKSVSYNEFPHSVINKLSSYFRNNPEESLKILNSSIVKYPKEQLFYLKLSSIYKHHFKDSEKYIDTLSKAVKECGESSELKILIGQHHYLNKNYQTAIKLYKESKLISNDKEEGYFVDFKSETYISN